MYHISLIDRSCITHTNIHYKKHVIRITNDTLVLLYMDYLMIHSMEYVMGCSLDCYMDLFIGHIVVGISLTMFF